MRIHPRTISAKYPDGSFKELALIYEDALCKAAPVAAHAPTPIPVPAAPLPIVSRSERYALPGGRDLSGGAVVRPATPAAATVQPPVAPGAGPVWTCGRKRTPPRRTDHPGANVQRGRNNTDEPRRVAAAPKPSTRAENQTPDLKKGETLVLIEGVKQLQDSGGTLWGRNPASSAREGRVFLWRTRKVWSDMSAQLGPPSSSQVRLTRCSPSPRPQELRDQKEGRRFGSAMGPWLCENVRCRHLQPRMGSATIQVVSLGSPSLKRRLIYGNPNPVETCFCVSRDRA